MTKQAKTAKEIRAAFLDFFAEKGHKIVPSAPLVNKSDPTLMFVNSGMAPFKDYFLGNRQPIALRIADTQKCLRVSGKHNDLEDVGKDGTHHTLFEMLGNWSFGDYFKTEAIEWSWELLTARLGLDPTRLYATVFGGDEAENLAPDDEARELWRKYLPDNQILYGSKKDNFWEMGEQGPCGPCSEIHVDMRSDEERKAIPGETLVNKDHPRVIEIWNNVFMQFERKADKSLVPLPACHVDTGMGFERLCMVLQNKLYTYDTDVFSPFIQFIEAESKIAYQGSYEANAYSDIAMRVVADHLRAVVFTVADGELPSNTGAGYVIRRILRRAVRYYYSYLGIKEPFMYKMVPLLVENFGEVFPEIAAQGDFVSQTLLSEERGFLRTLEGGLNRMETIEVVNGNIDGRNAFEMYDTFGFPFDLTRLIAEERGFTVDEAGFNVALLEQKTRSRKDAHKQVGDWMVIIDVEANFVGYDRLVVAETQVTKYRTVKNKKGDQFELVLGTTPFYAQGGGQEGDTGWLDFDGERIAVLDTRKENDLFIHIVDRLPEELTAVVRAEVDTLKRTLTESNHSATHLMHAALREVLGTHVAQKGSYLNENTLRFDFSHFQKVTDEEIERVERIVNEKIRENIQRDIRVVSIDEAREFGAMMLFGEKYGETVRMVTFDKSYSIELCGGCHVTRTGEIGLFRIVSESAVAAGVRRIEAVTALAAEEFIREEAKELAELRGMLNTKTLSKSVQQLQDDNKRLQQEIDKMMQLQANALQKDLKSAFVAKDGYQLLVTRVALTDAKVVKTLAYDLEKEHGPCVIVLGSIAGDKPLLTMIVSESLTATGLHAGKLVKEFAAHIKGSGGGQAFFATAGGTDAAGLDAALAAALAAL
jgi:alanyl-tRNA synthetase